MSATQVNGDFGRIRIPADLNERLDCFFSTLKLRVLEKAVRRASTRTNPNEDGELQQEDLAATAHEALAGAAIELNKALVLRELPYVRRAS